MRTTGIITSPASEQQALHETGPGSSPELDSVAETRSGETRSGETRSMQEVSEEEFDRVLEENQFEFAPAARQLRVSRQSVYRRIAGSPRHRLASQVPLQELRLALAAADGDVTAAALQLRVSASALRARLRAAGPEFS